MMLRFTTVTGALLLVHQVVYAGFFDCNVLYDEYESLMANQFLVAPERYVATKVNTFARTEFEQLQKGAFKLYPERADRGIGVFRSSANLHGKFLFRWLQPLPDQPPHVLIEQGVVYGRVADGYAPVLFAPLRLKPGSAVDLDTGRSAAFEPQGGPSAEKVRKQVDMVYLQEAQSGEYVLQAVNGALLHFPLESMCHRPQHGANSPRQN